MRIRLALLALMLAAFSNTVTASPTTFVGFLNGLNESPTNTSPGTGTAFVTIDPVAHLLYVNVSFTGLTSLNTAAHIHVINGPGDTDTTDTLGPVATTTPTFTGFPSGFTQGTFVATFDTTQASTYRAGFITSAGGIAQAEAALFAGITDGRAYFNIHTTNFPGGEIRDFLTPVPEPSTFALTITSLVGFAVLRRRGSR